MWINRLFQFGLGLIPAAMLVGCAHKGTPSLVEAAGTPMKTNMNTTVKTTSFDEFSYAEPDQARVGHLALDLRLDFERRILDGMATLSIEWLDSASDGLVLDTRDLAIRKVETREPGGWREARFELAARDAVLGSKLRIAMPSRSSEVRIAYSTSPDASGLQWLTPAMTSGKKIPFMFSQSQQIHARSWVPLQDTPRVRFTFECNVTAPRDVMVLMSAENDPAAVRDGNYHFRMSQPIPSYLLAIAAGDLVFKPITDRIGVWAEPAVAEAAASEFVDTGRMMEFTESLHGPYRWGRYDLLVLPPSFPYGGMENPRLTFMSPTVIAGDRSLVSVVAHELAHKLVRQPGDVRDAA